jgi:hypothetical protein
MTFNPEENVIEEPTAELNDAALNEFFEEESSGSEESCKETLEPQAEEKPAQEDWKESISALLQSRKICANGCKKKSKRLFATATKIASASF